MRSLAKDAGDRFASLRDFAEALTTPSASDTALAVRSLAVLPLANLSGDPDDAFLCEGLADEITLALSRLPGLRVASRTSAFALRNRGLDVRGIGAQLHVASVLEGSLRRAGTRLRITARLVDVSDGFVRWAEHWDRDLADVFTIQEETAHSVARALEVLLQPEAPPIVRAAPADVRAYEYYLRGRRFFRETRKKSIQFAREMFQQAIALDPGYALAWTGVADCCSLLHMYFPASSAADLAMADSASAKALELDPALPEAHAARGFALWRLKRTDEAITELETAARLDPRQFEARYFLARMRFEQGALADAAQLFEDAAHAREDYQARFFAAQSWAGLGRKAESEAAYRRALHVVRDHLALNPDDSRAATMAAVSHCRLGQQEEGLTWAARARAIDPDDAGVLYNVACLYALEARPDEAIDCLGAALQAGFGSPEWIAHDPDLDGLRGDPRFQSLLQTVHPGG
jgi:TolB-like protein/Flp pilus assembly protein TadD